jgi:hypothetical protein
MTPTRRGSIRLFRFAGIDLFVHWSWLCESTAGPACEYAHPLAAWEAGALREDAGMADASAGTPAS